MFLCHWNYAIFIFCKLRHRSMLGTSQCCFVEKTCVPSEARKAEIHNMLVVEDDQDSRMNASSLDEQPEYSFDCESGRAVIHLGSMTSLFVTEVPCLRESRFHVVKVDSEISFFWWRSHSLADYHVISIPALACFGIPRCCD